MDGKLKDLELITKITTRIEDELNQLKLWIKSQYKNLDHSNDDDVTVNFIPISIDSVCSNRNGKNLKKPVQVPHSNSNPSRTRDENHKFELKRYGLESSSTSALYDPDNDNDDDDDIEIIEQEAATASSDDEKEFETIDNKINKKDQNQDEFILGDDFSDEEEHDNDNNINVMQHVNVFPSQRAQIVQKHSVSPSTSTSTSRTRSVKNRVSSTISNSKLNKVNKLPNSNEKTDLNFTCHICQRSFVTNYRLDKHVETHSNQRNYGCCYCMKTFKTRNCVSTHIANQHSCELTDLPYPCVYVGCTATFKTDSARQKHFNLTHIGLPCHLCPRVFFKKNSHYLHLINAHICCTGCLKQFQNKNGLLIHRRVCKFIKSKT